ncbi:MAG TPA: FtsX-like permease family protein [Chryseolinea sp.]|nr:FtsX-like permease family protein [Chryseolinea sp.]
MLSRVARDVPDMNGSQVVLQPLTSIHLQSRFIDEYEKNGSTELVYLLLSIGATIMVMSWVNYVNIEAARFLRRSREVGVRRIIGSGKSDLALQFLLEFCGITALAVIASVGCIVLFSVPYTRLTGISIDLQTMLHWDLLWATLAFLTGGTLLTGIYPSLYVIRINPVQALKGSYYPQRGRYSPNILSSTFSWTIITINSSSPRDNSVQCFLFLQGSLSS